MKRATKKTKVKKAKQGRVVTGSALDLPTEDQRHLVRYNGQWLRDMSRDALELAVTKFVVQKYKAQRVKG